MSRPTGSPNSARLDTFGENLGVAADLGDRANGVALQSEKGT